MINEEYKPDYNKKVSTRTKEFVHDIIARFPEGIQGGELIDVILEELKVPKNIETRTVILGLISFVNNSTVQLNLSLD